MKYRKKREFYKIINLHFDFLDYDWLGKKATEIRSATNYTIMKNFLKIEVPDFDTLRSWIIAEHKDLMSGSKQTDKQRKKVERLVKRKWRPRNLRQIKGEACKRFTFDYSPTVEFKSKRMDKFIKISRWKLIDKLKTELSSKRCFYQHNELDIYNGICETSRNFAIFLSGKEFNNSKPSRLMIRAPYLLNQYILKFNLNSNSREYTLLRGIIQDIVLIHNSLRHLRSGLNLFHIMNILGFDYLFFLDGLCLYYETLLNPIFVSIKSLIERFWRITHNFFFGINKKLKEIVKSEISNCQIDSRWIGSLEEVYSIITCMHQKHEIIPFDKENKNFDLFLDYSDVETILLINTIRNSYIHSDPRTSSGIEKEKLKVLVNKRPYTFTIYDFFISNPKLFQNIDRGFKQYLINKKLDISNIDLDDPYYQEVVLKRERILWRAPTIMEDMLQYTHYPSLYGIYKPRGKIYIFGSDEYYEYNQEIVNYNGITLKNVQREGEAKISLFNLCACLWSLFNSLDRLLVSFLMKKLYET